MPWQRHVADVALEIDPDTGLLAYREVRLLTPRQSGKTTLILSLAVQRALGFGRPQSIVYTAQTRNDAREKWEREHVEALDHSAFAGLYKVDKTNGREALRWKNGSSHGITSTTEKAGHGKTLDLAFADEAFAQVDARLEQALKPTMITRPQPQLWVVSTAGWLDTSIYLWDKVTDGRERAERGVTQSVAYFEWSAPDDADPADPATWWAWLPALGHTVTEDAVRETFDSMPLPDFRRAFLNQWRLKHSDDPVISDEAWAACFDEDSHLADPVVFAVDTTPDRDFTSIAAAGRRRDGLAHVELVDNREGTRWVVARLVELRDRWRPAAIVLDNRGPAASLLTELADAGVEVQLTNTSQMAQACGGFFDAVTADEPTVRHLGSPKLTAALGAARKRPLGDAWAWKRKDGTDISPLVATSLAWFGLQAFMPDRLDEYDATRSFA